MGAVMKNCWQGRTLCRYVERLSAGRRVESGKGGDDMIRRLMHVFALSEKGAKDFVKAVIWCFLCNISLMLPVGVVIGTIQYLMNALETGGDPMDQIWLYTGLRGGYGCGALLYCTIFSTRLSIWRLTRRAPAEGSAWRKPLRKLPLSFFGNRDLSDLTSTMIADCSSLDQMFSHYIPQLFASIFSDAVHRNLYVVY